MEIWKLEKLSAEPHRPQVLRSDDGATRVIALTLPKGEQLQEHQVHEHALLLVVSGELALRGGNSEHALTPGSLVHFDPAERHEVEATTETRLVLFLSPWPGPGHPSLAA
jgi:quercetin dioxygenase-like cupin family protein